GRFDHALSAGAAGQKVKRKIVRPVRARVKFCRRETGLLHSSSSNSGIPETFAIEVVSGRALYCPGMGAPRDRGAATRGPSTPLLSGRLSLPGVSTALDFLFN